MSSLHTILGAGGIIADGLAIELTRYRQPVRLVSRHPSPVSGATTHPADLTDPRQTLEAIRGSAVVYCCIGLPYNYSIWRRDWPRIIDNLVEACKTTGARLLFFDNVYMYGKTTGPMTEETPYDPDSRKGDLRARMATLLMSEVRKGHITAAIARAADFYGPGADKTGLPNLLIFQRLLKGQRAQWLVNARVRHSFTYVPDAVRALCLLGRDDNSWNQVWHLPTAAEPLTGEQFVEKAAAALGRKPRLMVMPKGLIRLGGIFDRTTAEICEMLYQYESEYLFDSAKFEKAYSFQPASYEEGIRATAASYLERDKKSQEKLPK